MINYCCKKFIELVENAGEKGIGIIPVNAYSFEFFVMQFRNLGPEAKVGILSMTEVTIHFCPFCGKKLMELIEENREEFANLARRNSHFLIMNE